MKSYRANKIIYFSSFLIFLLYSIHAKPCYAQEFSYDIDFYDFIKYDKNVFVFPGNDSIVRQYSPQVFFDLFTSFNKLIMKGQGQINIVHIGDSHIQADILTGRIRNRIQTFFAGSTRSRGFLFPYLLAGSTNAVNFTIEHIGIWYGLSIIDKAKTCITGLSGYSITTFDHLATISFIFPEWMETKYECTRLKIFHNLSDTSFIVDIDNYFGNEQITVNDTLGYTQFLLDEEIDTLCLRLIKTDSCQKFFTLYGISFETEEPGVFYHAIGVNGAKTNTFLRCPFFILQLLSLEPDWVIISLGTNDIYSEKFNVTNFALEYGRLLRAIRYALPNVPVLLTTISDSYYSGRYPNPFTNDANKAIYKLAKYNECAVWDFYEIMGGFDSSSKWLEYGLAKNDKLHFSKDGYILQGDLFFQAFLDSYDRFIENSNKNKGCTK
ncbi:MAG: hypothetical protein HY738_20850 [Bacteroidia bacterium]|nr:hypothetical protein [Bacteroidia bacterium]